MSRCWYALSTLRANHEKVKRIFACYRMVHAKTWFWIHKSVSLVYNEFGLDLLIYHHEDYFDVCCVWVAL